MNADKACYRDSFSANSDDSWSRNRLSLACEVSSIVWIFHPASHPFDHRTIANSMSKYVDSPS